MAITIAQTCPTGGTSSWNRPPNRLGATRANPMAHSGLAGQGPYPRPATSPATTTYDGPTSRMCSALAGTAPVAIRMARIPSLITVPRTCAVPTSARVRQAPSRHPTLARPMRDSPSQPATSPSVSSAETTSVDSGWSVALARLVLAQSSQRSPTRRGYRTAAARRGTPWRRLPHGGRAEDRGTQPLDPFAQGPVGRDHDPGPARRLPADEVDDRVVTRPGRGHDPYPLDAGHVAGLALDDQHHLDGRGQAGHALAGERRQPVAQPCGGRGAVPPPAVGYRTHDVGRVDYQQRWIIHAVTPCGGR